MARTLSMTQRRAEDAAIALLYLNDEKFDAEGESVLRRAWYWTEMSRERVYLTDGYTKFAKIERREGAWRTTLLIKSEA